MRFAHLYWHLRERVVMHSVGARADIMSASCIDVISDVVRPWMLRVRRDVNQSCCRRPTTDDGRSLARREYFCQLSDYNYTNRVCRSLITICRSQVQYHPLIGPRVAELGYSFRAGGDRPTPTKLKIGRRGFIHSSKMGAKNIYITLKISSYVWHQFTVKYRL